MTIQTEVQAAQSGPKPEKPPYEILVDRRPHKWPKPSITGLEIKKLAGVDPATYGAWQDIPGQEDKPIADNEQVDLIERGVEKFFTGKKTTTEG